MISAKVTRIVDGDTIHIITKNPKGLKDKPIVKRKIRLSNIDAPELSQDFGKISSLFLETLIPVTTVIEIKFELNKDKYGRYLGTIFRTLNGHQHNINKIMVEQGYAWNYDQTYVRERNSAARKMLGLWYTLNENKPPENPKIYKKKKHKRQ